MAFLGDFGNFFLGGRTTRDVGGAIGETVGSIFGPAGAVVGGSIGRDIGKDIGEIGSDNVDVTAPSAGIDSPASTTAVSQTGQLQPSGTRFATNVPQRAGIGALSPFLGLGQQALRTLTRPGVGGAVTGFGGAVAADFIIDMFGNQKKLVITRKLQREVKKVFQMSMGDINFVSANSMALFGKQLSTDQIFMIMFKTFKNQGPYVTRAAVRKTRSTIRKMEVLCDLKDRLAPPRRAAPRRRTMGSTTKVLQVK